jgi:DNA mismatch endonuclease (patch repair protein)
MADVFTKAKRSDVMSRIRGHGNKDTELALMRLFRTYGITGWRRKYAVFGKPDFVFPKLRLAVFVDGCFWHACPRHFRDPKNNAEFWQRKFDANILRDRLATRVLRAKGWYVLRIWEHELTPRTESRTMRRIRTALARASSG